MSETPVPSEGTEKLTVQNFLRHHLPILGIVATCTTPLILAAYAGIPEAKPVFWGIVAGGFLYNVLKSEMQSLLYRTIAWIVFFSFTELWWTSWAILGGIPCLVTFEA